MNIETHIKITEIHGRMMACLCKIRQHGECHHYPIEGGV